jgi:hypothetical protein
VKHQRIEIHSSHNNIIFAYEAFIDTSSKYKFNSCLYGIDDLRPPTNFWNKDSVVCLF